jgi:hypothetical protein
MYIEEVQNLQSKENTEVAKLTEFRLILDMERMGKMRNAYKILVPYFAVAFELRKK